MSDCIFCKIAGGEIPADIVYQDEEILAFRDLEPQAPVHVLIIPRRHIASADALEDTEEDRALMGHLLSRVPTVAAALGLANGYRVVNNCGVDGLQTVQHLHFHMLGGRQMLWPPG